MSIDQQEKKAQGNISEEELKSVEKQLGDTGEEQSPSAPLLGEDAALESANKTAADMGDKEEGTNDDVDEEGETETETEDDIVDSLEAAEDAAGEGNKPVDDNEMEVSEEADDGEPRDEVEEGKEVREENEEKKAAPKANGKARKKRNAKDVAPLRQVRIVHMVFDEPGGEQIRQSFELEPEYAGDIIYIEDNYSLGPVSDLQEPAGWQARKQWWQSVLGLPEDEQPEVMTSDKMKLHQLFQRLEEEEDTVLWIWMGQNERDVAGYFQVISQLMEYHGRIQVLYLNNLPFIDEKGHIFYPRQLAEILPKEFVKASRLARVVTLSEFELDPEQWDKLSKQTGSVRLLEGGKKLAVKEDEYYDKLIVDQLGAVTMKLSRLISLLATKAKLGLPEYYVFWRIKSLIDAGQIISQGDFEKGAKNVTLKATRGEMFVELDGEQADETPEDGSDN